MTFLPIVQRELRVQARGGANYWGRLAVAAAGVLVCVPPLLMPAFSPTGGMGRAAFDGLVSAAFLLCCAACLFTADTISSERRQGTLGLLLLTRVNHFDVLLGKFASRGLVCLLSLMAFLPVLALPLLAGGVTGPEAARKAAALAATLFLALSVGFWASARGCDWFRTARTAFLACAGLVLGPVMLGLLLPGTHAGVASPLGTIARAGDLAYGSSTAPYWLSLGLVQLLAWAFLLGAIISLRRQAGDIEDGDLESRRTRRVVKHGAEPAPTQCRYCGRENLLEAIYCRDCGTELHPRVPQTTRAWNLSSTPTPLHWLLRRQRGLKPMLWAAALVGFAYYGLYGLIQFVGSAVGLLIGVSWALNLAVLLVTGSIFAWVASRFFVDARRTGELELLMTTPLGAEQTVSIHWEFLKRLLRWPVAVMLFPQFLQGFTVLAFAHAPGAWVIHYVPSLLLSAANTVVGVVAVCWLALWLGLRGVGQGRTILWAVLLAKGLPYLLILVWWMLSRIVFLWFLGPGNSWWGWALSSHLPQLAWFLYSLWLFRFVRGQALNEAPTAELLTLREILAAARRRAGAGVRCVRQWPAINPGQQQ